MIKACLLTNNSKVETEVAESIAVPTPTGKPDLKRKAGEQVPKVSKRLAKGTKREKG